MRSGWIAIGVIYLLVALTIFAKCMYDRSNKPEGFSPIINHSEIK